MEQVAWFVPADHLTFTEGINKFTPDPYHLNFVAQPSTSKYPVQMSDIKLDMGKQLTVQGNAPIKKLALETMYEVVFGVMFTSNATPWDDVTMTLRLNVPGGTLNASEQIRTQSLVVNPPTELYWREILVGDFIRSNDMDEAGNLIFDLVIDTTSAKIKHEGLVIMGVSIRRVPNYPLKPPPTMSHLDTNNHWHLDVTKLLIHRGLDKGCWKLNLVSEGSDTYVPELQLIDIVWLHVTGKFEAKALHQGSMYEVVLLIMLDSNAKGWDQTEVTLKINDEETSEKVNGPDYANYKELSVGQITASDDTKNNGIQFSLLETTSGISKSGLRIKAAQLRKL